MHEPTTAVTDYLLGALAVVLGRRLSRPDAAPAVARRLWAASFLVLAVAAFAGGTWHALPPAVAPGLRYHLWSITYAAIGLADLLLAAGAVRATLPHAASLAAFVLLTGRFVVYAASILSLRDFRYVGYDYGVTLLILVLCGLALWWRKEAAAASVIAGALTSFAGGLVQGLHLAPHPRFNHNDLFHVIQMAAIGLLYQGGRRLRDR